MAGIGKDFQFRAFDPAMEELGILYRREFVILSTEDKRGKMNLLKFFHTIKSITRCEVAIEDFWPTLKHLVNAPLD
jgi:hypothetical protein